MTKDIDNEELENSDKKTSKATKALKFTLTRIVLPVSAMRKTLYYAKREIQENKKNFGYIKELGKKSIEIINTTEEEQKNQSFEEAINHRGKDALPIDELKKFFMNKKRVSLFFGLAFLLFSSYTLIAGYINQNNKTIFLSCLSILCATPLFFLSALTSELRIWQLTTKRLSKEENGGLKDFLQVKAWWLQVLNPYLKGTCTTSKKGEKNEI